MYFSSNLVADDHQCCCLFQTGPSSIFIKNSLCRPQAQVSYKEWQFMTHARIYIPIHVLHQLYYKKQSNILTEIFLYAVDRKPLNLHRRACGGLKRATKPRRSSVLHTRLNLLSRKYKTSLGKIYDLSLQGCCIWHSTKHGLPPKLDLKNIYFS